MELRKWSDPSGCWKQGTCLWGIFLSFSKQFSGYISWCQVVLCRLCRLLGLFSHSCWSYKLLVWFSCLVIHCFSVLSPPLLVSCRPVCINVPVCSSCEVSLLLSLVRFVLVDIFFWAHFYQIFEFVFDGFLFSLRKINGVYFFITLSLCLTCWSITLTKYKNQYLNYDLIH